MRVTIDGSGRIVLPKRFRDELKLEGGTTLELRVREGRIELEPVTVPMRLVRRGKGLVATTEEPLPRLSAADVRSVLESQRR
jgi:AbrB family looped-hinge helix DNA binding protein